MVDKREIQKIRREADRRGVSLEEYLCSVDVIEKIAEIAEEEGKTVNEVISEILADLIKAVENESLTLGSSKRKGKRWTGKFYKKGKKDLLSYS